MELAIYILLGYLMGALPCGVWVAKSKGVDLFTVGSGNPGATNVGRALGFKWGIFVFILDALKGFIPTFATLILTHSIDLAMLVGIAAVLGHSFSFLLKFKGGKAISTAWGVFMGLSWSTGLLAIAVFIAMVLLTRKISVGSITAALSVMLCGLLIPTLTLFAKITYILIGLFAIVRHIPNIKRLLKGEEPNISFKRTS